MNVESLKYFIFILTFVHFCAAYRTISVPRNIVIFCRRLSTMRTIATFAVIVFFPMRVDNRFCISSRSFYNFFINIIYLAPITLFRSGLNYGETIIFANFQNFMFQCFHINKSHCHSPFGGSGTVSIQRLSLNLTKPFAKL